MNTGTRMTVHRMKTTLKSAGDEAGIMNRRSEFSMPMQAAATATSSRNGMLMRVSEIVSDVLPACSSNPGAYVSTRGRTNTVPTITNAPVTTIRALMTCDPSRHAASRPSV